MTPLAEWPESDIHHQIKSYRQRLSWLERDFAERTKELRGGVEQLEAELARRQKAGTTNTTVTTERVDT